MREESVIIIGAGLAGLATGCYAQMNGYQSHIFEHHSQPGGVAAAWKRGSYLIDGGIHFVMSHKPGTGLHEVYRQLGIVPTVRFVDLTTYGRFIDEASGQRVEIDQDLERLGRDLRTLAPADARIVDELVAGAQAFRGLDMSEIGLSKPPELSGPLGPIKDLWPMRRLFKYLIGRYGRPVADYTQAVEVPWLQALIKSLFLPEVPVYFIFMLLGLLADGQLGLIDGSCYDLVRAVEKRYLDLGGQVTYRATVAEILVEDDHAVGVRLAGGEEHRAGAVVSAADGYSTIFRMLGGRYANDKIRRRYETWPRFQPIIMASYGVRRTFLDEPVFTSILLKDPIRIARQAVAAIFVRIFNYSTRFAPPGRTVVQVEFETEWDHWHKLQTEDRAGYVAEKKRVAEAVLQRLEAYYPGLSSQVEVSDVCTPYTFWRYTLNDRGAWEGWLMTPKTIQTLIERRLPGLADFYMAGQWVMPGGGVPPVLYSGQHAVQLLCRRDEKPFCTAAP